MRLSATREGAGGQKERSESFAHFSEGSSNTPLSRELAVVSVAAQL